MHTSDLVEACSDDAPCGERGDLALILGEDLLVLRHRLGGNSLAEHRSSQVSACLSAAFLRAKRLSAARAHDERGMESSCAAKMDDALRKPREPL